MMKLLEFWVSNFDAESTFAVFEMWEIKASPPARHQQAADPDSRSSRLT